MPELPEIHGSCDERFALVGRALAANFREHDELGAAVAIAVEGKPVVDIWAGWADEARTRPWQRDTLVDVFSVGKSMAAVCLLKLVERHRVDLEAPVAGYWPEFAQQGKSEITVRMVMCHAAGLPAIRRLLPRDAMYDWGLMTSALAGEATWWEPGRRHGYHVNTFGFLTGEIVRRVSGQSIGEFFLREVAAPLDADFRFGIGAEQDSRVADYLFVGELPDSDDREWDLPPGDGDGAPDLTDSAEEHAFLLHRVYLNPPGVSGLGTVNTRAWRAAEMPSTNGHATARAVSRIYSALACGGALGGTRILQTSTIEQAIAEASCGPDAILGRPSRFGLGFQLTQPERPLGPSPRSFGHFGAGGSLGFADPDAGLAFAYTMNRAGPRWQNPRNKALIDAVYEAL